MKKKICIILLLVFMIVGISNQTSAVHITGQSIPIFHEESWICAGNECPLYNNKVDIKTKKGYVEDGSNQFIELDAKDYISDILKQQYGYEGPIMTKMLIETKVTITDKSLLGKYTVYIGKDPEKDKRKFGGVMKKLTKEDLQLKLGYHGTQPKEGEHWPVKILATMPQERGVGSRNTNDFSWNQNVDITGEEIWTLPDMNTVSDDVLDGAVEPSFIVGDFVEEVIINPVKEWVADKAAEFFGKLFVLILDFFREIPDAFQRGVNSFGKIDTIEAKTANAAPDEISYESQTLQADSNKNNRAKVEIGNTNTGDPDKQEVITMDGKDEKFTKDTKIPSIPLDMYNIVYGNVKFLDVNFFVVDNSKHEAGSNWMYVRNIFAMALHIMIYLCTGFLIAVLITYGVSIVKGTVLPSKKKEQIDGLKHFVLALIMLICSVLIMNICIYGTNALVDTLGNKEEGDGFFRINVAGDTNYSFTANVTEFVRYMTQINSVDKIGDKLMYIFLYTFLVIGNVAALGIMLIRSIFIVILSVQGPIIATAYSLDKKVFNMSYSDWIKKYLKWTSIQVALMIGYKIIITIATL